MIKYLKRNQIDIQKYDTCIELAINSRIYAYSWYLDIVADNWDALVLNDYEAVMPLPWKEKYFIKYIYPPAWTQQLGVFSKLELDAQLVKCFIDIIPRKFKKITIQFNSGNDLSLFKTEKRVNYVIELNKEYKDIYIHYRKDRKKDLKKSNEIQLSVIKEFDFDILLQVYRLAFPNLNFDQKDFISLSKLLNFCNSSGFGFQRTIYLETKAIGSAFFLQLNNRIYYLFGASIEGGKKYGVTTFNIDLTIKEFSNKNFVFDFEGSMMPGVKEFYKSFGGNEEVFLIYEQRFRLLKS